MAKLFDESFYTALDSNGVPVSGARLFFYLTGTSTKSATYTNNALSVAHTNPVVADAAGRFAPIYLQHLAYKVILAPAGTDDPPTTSVKTIDPLNGALATVLDSTGNEILEFAEVASAVNYWKISNAATAGRPKLEVLGDDTNVGAEYQTKGIGSHLFTKGSNETVLEVSGPASTVNKLHIKATATGSSPSIDAEGTDANIGISWLPKGSGNVEPYGISFPQIIPGFISGLARSSAADADHDVTIATGFCVDSTDLQVLNLTTAITKQIDAVWALGTDAGGLDTGTVAADTDYFLHLIKRSDTGVTDALYSLSATAPTMPTDYDFFRPLEALRTDSSSNLLAPGPRATTSGTEHRFYVFRSDAKRVTVKLSGVSTDGVAELLIQLGDSGGIEATGYVSSATEPAVVNLATSTTGFIITANQAAGDAWHGNITIDRSGANTWVAGGSLADAAGIALSAGGKSLSDTLTQFRVTTTNGTDVFDTGSVDVLVE